jgi:hypothetical protein
MSLWRVEVADHVTPALVSDGGARTYISPPQPEEHARSLVAIVLGHPPGNERGPWRLAIAGGQRTVELRSEP